MPASLICALALAGGAGLARTEDRGGDSANAPQPDSVYSATARKKRPAEPGSAPVSTPAMIDEMTIIGRKQLERPTSVTSLDESALRNRTARRVDDVAAANLQIDEALGNANAARISLRGIGTGDPIITSDQPVGIVVDGVLQPRAQGALVDLANAERVDVLRGPQGTLSGATALGGVINITTRKPTFDFGGNAALRLGNFDLLETQVALNVPLVPERVAARLSLSTAQRDGFARNRFVGGGSTVGRNRMVGGRLDLLWNAGEDLELLFSADRSYAPRSPIARKCRFVGLPGAPNDTAANRRFGAVSGSPLQAPTTLAERDAALALSQRNAQTGGDFARACRADEEGDPRSVFADSPLRDDLVSSRATLSATWKPFDSVVLRSTTGLVLNDTDRDADGDATGLPLQGSFRGDLAESENRALSETLQLTGSALSRKLQWTGGLFAMSEDNRARNRDRAFPGTARNPAFLRAQGTNAEENARIDAILAGDPSLADPALAALLRANPSLMRRPVAGFALATGFGECLRVPGDDPNTLRASCLRAFQAPLTESSLDSDGTSYALFGDLSYQLTPKLSVGAGLRAQRDRRSIDRFGRIPNVEDFAQRTDPSTQLFGLDGDPANGGRFVAPALLGDARGVTTDFSDSDRATRFTPRLSIQYAFSGTANAFATYSQSTRPGPLNGRAVGRGAGARDPDPEVLTQYEFGVRSSWFQRRLLVDASLFNSIQTDIQRTLITGGSAADGLIRGGELDLTAIPAPRLVLTSSLGVTDARYTNLSTPPNQRSLRDARFPNTPAYTMDFAANYSMTVGTLGDLRTRLTWRHEGAKGSDTFDSDLTRVSKRGTLGGRIALELPDGNTTVALFGANLLDRETPSNILDLSQVNGTVQQIFGAPRTYGLEILRRF